MRWFRRRTQTFTVVWGGPKDFEGPPAEQRGNVTATHREILSRLSLTSEAAWSHQALWACSEELRTSVITAAAEVRVEYAWTDGPDAFCVIYTPPFQPDNWVGLRRHYTDEVAIDYGLSSVLYLDRLKDTDADPATTDVPNPIAFGVAVAVFDIGEPLGSTSSRLRTDGAGVGWWGTLEVDLPRRPT